MSYQTVASYLGFDGALFIRVGIAFVITYVLTFPIGRERERDDQSAGVRTFPIVAISSCSYILLASSVFPPGSDSHGQVLHGLIAGIGFIGGGAIVKDEQRVRGTATAASIWAASAIGAAVGYGRWEIALLLALTTFLTLRLWSRSLPTKTP